MSPIIRPLVEVDPEAVGTFGGKACGLARLVAAGVAVPPGFAVAADSEDAWSAGSWSEFERHAAALLARGTIAVRSSAVGEDSPERSFAGLFETVLGVATTEAAVVAARRCLASGASERVRTYAGVDDIPVGLVVQRQIAARSAGVCFTVDPSGKDRAIVVEAVAGTGDALVSGRAQPERWRVYRTGLGTWEARRDRRSAQTALSAEEAVEVARGAADLAAREKRPLDLEWALDPSGLWWLQARPITAATPPPDIVVERFSPGDADGPVTVWSNWNVRETMPDPLTPLSATVWRDIVLPIVLQDITGIARGSALMRHHMSGIDLVHGRIYWNMNGMLGWPLGRLMFPTVDIMDPRAGVALRELAAAGVLVPRRSPLGLGAALALVGAGFRIFFRITTAFRPRHALASLARCGARIEARPDVATFTDAELLSEMELLGAPESDTFRRAIQMLAATLVVYLAADRAFRHHPEARQLLPAGIRGNPTTEISVGIDALVVAARPLAAAFADPLPTDERLARVAQEPGGTLWLDQLRAFLAHSGQRGPKEFDIAAPRWADDPGMILDLVCAGLQSPGRETATERLTRLAGQRRQAVEAAVAAAPWWRRPLLRPLARLLELYMPLREAPKHEVMHVFRRMRLAALELGARLAGRGALDHAGDVFFLEWPEVQGLFDGAPATDVRPLIQQRQQRQQRYAREKPPEILRSDGVPVEVEGAEPADGILRGTGASSGQAAGPVRILREPDPKAMSDGDVIVMEFADPGWTPLFPRAAAVVMEVGGIMCHAAVVARELGVPAVFGVAAATRILQDGQRVVVDGGLGTIERRAHPR